MAENSFVNRFKRIYSAGSRSSSERIVIYVDKVTGVTYFFFRDGYGGGLTPLLDENGKPVITPIDKVED